PCRIATRRTGKDNGLPFRMMTKKCHHSGKRIAPPYYSKASKSDLFFGVGVSSNHFSAVV
ncbi:MAG: hypothetical protein LBS21_16095, partial [Clostridiales bacterium]|nr:hypothetical protein [Clostridiales bacterium]